MAKGFKKQLQGGGFQNLSISGSAQLQNMRIQSDIEINALKEQRARQKQLDESQLTDLRRSYKNEQANRDSIQKLEVNRQKLEYENHQLMAKRDIENKRAQAKQKAAEAKMWSTLSPTLAKNLGNLASGLIKFNDIQSGMEQYRELDAAGAFDTFEAQMYTLNEEAVKGLQDKRNDAIYNGNLDESDYLGDAFRGNGYYFQKLVTNRIQNDLPAHVADLKAYISENDLAKNPYDMGGLYEFRAQEILAQYGIDPMTNAGISIQKMFQEEGAKQQANAVLGSKYATYEEKFRRDKENHAAVRSQDSFDQLVSTYLTGYTRTKSGAIVSHYGTVNAMEAAETILTEMATSGDYATDWKKFKNEQLIWLSPIGPGNTKREAWMTKNPSMVQRIKEAWTANQDKLKSVNKALNEQEDTAKTFDIDEQNRNGDFDGDQGTAKLVAAYFSNQGNPNAQARAAKLLYVNTTENNKATVDLVMKAIRQNDVQEFVSLLDGLSETQVSNIVGATPFLETTNALIESHGVDFDKDIDSFASSVVKDLAANSFSLSGDANDNADRAIVATKQLYYHLFNKRFAGIKEPDLRREKTENFILDLAKDKSQEVVGDRTYIGSGIFRRIDAGSSGTNTVLFTQFYNGTLPNNAVDFSKSGDINLNDGRTLPQILKSVKQKNLNLISTSDLEDVAVALREGKDVITMPQNLRLLEKKFKNFDGRKYLNELFRENEQYKKEGIFIPPTMYDAARAAGGPMRQVDALKYMIGQYKDGELVKNDAL